MCVSFLFYHKYLFLVLSSELSTAKVFVYSSELHGVQQLENLEGYRKKRTTLLSSTSRISGICIDRLRVQANTSQDKGSPELNSEISEQKYLTMIFRLSCTPHPHHNLFVIRSYWASHKGNKQTDITRSVSDSREVLQHIPSHNYLTPTRS